MRSPCCCRVSRLSLDSARAMGSDPLSFQGGYRASDGRWYSIDGRYVWDGARWRPHQGDQQWKKLELAVAAAYRRQGYGVEVTGGESAGDGGIDLVLRRDSRTTLVQIKNWWRGEPVGVDKVRELWGLVGMRGAQGAVFITRSDFTAAAYQEAARCPGLQLINHVGLAGLLATIPGGADLLDAPPPAPVHAEVANSRALPAGQPRSDQRGRRRYRRTSAGRLEGAVALVVALAVLGYCGLQSRNHSTSLFLPQAPATTLVLDKPSARSVISLDEASKEVRAWWSAQEIFEMTPDPAGATALFSGVAAEAAAARYASLKAQQKHSLGPRPIVSVDVLMPAQSSYPIWYAAAVSFHPVDANGASEPFTATSMSFVFEKASAVDEPKATWYDSSGSPLPAAVGKALIGRPSTSSLMPGQRVPTAYVDFLTRTTTESQTPPDTDPFARPNYQYVGLTAVARTVQPTPSVAPSFSLPSDAGPYRVPLIGGGEIVLFPVLRLATYSAGPTCIVQPANLTAFGPSLPAGKYQTVSTDALLMAVANVPPASHPANSGVPRIDMTGEIDTGAIVGTPPSKCR
jgi:hypothetical protein